MKKRIIRVWHSGLGDALQLSTLPSLYHAIGDEVWISDKTPCNDQVYELVWGENPYVKGKTSMDANCGEIPGNEYKNLCDSFIGNWEMINGFNHTNDYPIIYYEPKIYKDLENCTLIDMSCKSRKEDYDINKLQEYLDNIDNELVYQLSGNGIYNDRDYGFMRMVVNTIFDLCDYINSCKKYICLNSGGHSLASALKRNKDIDVDCLVTHTPTFDSMYVRKNFFYPNINYVWL